MEHTWTLKSDEMHERYIAMVWVCSSCGVEKKQNRPLLPDMPGMTRKYLSRPPEEFVAWWRQIARRK